MTSTLLLEETLDGLSRGVYRFLDGVGGGMYPSCCHSRADLLDDRAEDLSDDFSGCDAVRFPTDVLEVHVGDRH